MNQCHDLFPKRASLLFCTGFTSMNAVKRSENKEEEEEESEDEDEVEEKEKGIDKEESERATKRRRREMSVYSILKSEWQRLLEREEEAPAKSKKEAFCVQEGTKDKDNDLQFTSANSGDQKETCNSKIRKAITDKELKEKAKRAKTDFCIFLNASCEWESTSTVAMETYIENCKTSGAFQGAAQNLPRLAMRIHHLLDHCVNSNGSNANPNPLSLHTYAPLIECVWLCADPSPPLPGWGSDSEPALLLWGALKRLCGWHGGKLKILCLEKSALPTLLKWGELLGAQNVMMGALDIDKVEQMEAKEVNERENSKETGDKLSVGNSEMNGEAKIDEGNGQESIREMAELAMHPPLKDIFHNDYFVWESAMLCGNQDKSYLGEMTLIEAKAVQTIGDIEHRRLNEDNNNNSCNKGEAGDGCVISFTDCLEARGNIPFPRALVSYGQVLDTVPCEQVPSFYLSEKMFHVELKNNQNAVEFLKNHTDKYLLIEMYFEHACFSTKSLNNWKKYILSGKDGTREGIRMEIGPILFLKFYPQWNSVKAIVCTDISSLCRDYMVSVDTDLCYESSMVDENETVVTKQKDFLTKAAEFMNREEKQFLGNFCELERKMKSEEEAKGQSKTASSREVKTFFKQLKNQMDSSTGSKEANDSLSFKRNLRLKVENAPNSSSSTASQSKKRKRSSRSDLNLNSGSFFFNGFSSKDKQKFTSNISAWFPKRKNNEVTSSKKMISPKSFYRDKSFQDLAANLIEESGDKAGVFACPAFGVEYNEGDVCAKKTSYERVIEQLDLSLCGRSKDNLSSTKRKTSSENKFGDVRKTVPSLSNDIKESTKRDINIGRHPPQRSTFRARLNSASSTLGSECNDEKEEPDKVKAKKKTLYKLVTRKIKEKETNASKERCKSMYIKFYKVCSLFWKKDKTLEETPDDELANLVDTLLPDLISGSS
eukprot:Nk52_evm29s224 gene=Nk52_evmTU29s224